MSLELFRPHYYMSICSFLVNSGESWTQLCSRCFLLTATRLVTTKTVKATKFGCQVSG